jgi:hypothetical protein
MMFTNMLTRDVSLQRATIVGAARIITEMFGITV